MSVKGWSVVLTLAAAALETLNALPEGAAELSAYPAANTFVLQACTKDRIRQAKQFHQYYRQSRQGWRFLAEAWVVPRLMCGIVNENRPFWHLRNEWTS